MLDEFITNNRDALIERCRAKISTRPAPRATDLELEHGVPLFLDQLADTLRHASSETSAMAASASKHGAELLHRGFTIAQVVHDYGGVCQAITELAGERGAEITASEFQCLNLCIDIAIAAAVTEYGRLRGHEGSERLGHLAHELRNLLNTAVLSFEVLKLGTVGIGGSTGAILARSLGGLRDLIDRELAEVRLGAGAAHRATLVVCEFIEDQEVVATMEANARGLQFSAHSLPREVTVHADPQILASVVGNLLQNAFKFTQPGGLITLRARATADRVLIDVEDQCGGLPEGASSELFRPFSQRGADRSGLGLGLSISQRGALASDGELRVQDRPGTGCVFTLDLPRSSPAASAGAGGSARRASS